jgi:hypothetical protein
MADWNGPPAPDDSGAIAVDGFNAFLSNHPDLARSPIRAATEFVRLKDPQALTTRVIAQASQLEDPDEVRVLLTEDGLADDSIRAVRYRLEFSRRGRRWRLESARRVQRCQPGRGHQRFSAQALSVGPSILSASILGPMLRLEDPS